jgi:hypothetical protein
MIRLEGVVGYDPPLGASIYNNEWQFTAFLSMNYCCSNPPDSIQNSTNRSSSF